MNAQPIAKELTEGYADYKAFLESKLITYQGKGTLVAESDINPVLFPFQRDIVRWAFQLERAALFEECGSGKTLQELEWSRLVAQHTGGKVINLAPLAVGAQTVREGLKLGLDVKQCKSQSDIGDAQIVIVNYERLHLFDLSQFVGVVLDESSILKNYTGKTKQALIEAFWNTRFKLAATATPAPNDHLELGNHAEFLGIMPSNEMIMRWFINDTMEAGGYRLKEHARKDFWRWLTSWAVCISRPGDLGAGYDMPEFTLPELNIIEHSLSANQQTIDRTWSEGKLLPDTSPSSTGLHKVKRESLQDRISEARRILDAIPADKPVVIWCDTNYEADALIKEFPEASEVRGSHSWEVKEARLNAFTEGKTRLIITKPDIAGFGLNWQHCAHCIDVGVGYSFEKTYQKIRRIYRYGQTESVQVHMIYAETEGGVMETLRAKQEAFSEMQSEMNAAMAEHGLFREGKQLSLINARQNETRGANWTMYLGDCVTEIANIPDSSIDFGIHSPPFANLYIYSDNAADMGNSADDVEFFKHYEFLIKEMYRITKPGRLCAVHCKDLPQYMNRDGAAGLKDFPGDIIRVFERNDWQYHSRVTIWKDPVIEMQRTKNHGLLHKNFTERAEACRQGMPDYLLVFRKWPIEGGTEIKQRREIGDYIGTSPPTEFDIRPTSRAREDNYSIAVWQRYASPVWFDIDQTDVLNYQLARAGNDEKHIAPLQLGVIARSIDIWSMPGETVFSPFAGIGSEGYEAIRLGRKFVGIELKDTYYKIACDNLNVSELKANRPTLFNLSDFVGQE